jgi:hypothetical protein
MANQSSSIGIVSEFQHDNHSILPSIALSNVASLIPIRLDDSNYFIWKALFEPVLYSNHLMNHINRTSMPPDQTYLEFLEWFERDQTVISWINSTLSLSVLRYVVGAITTHDLAWTRLTARFGIGTRTHELTLRKRLLHIKKEASTH